MQTANIVNNYTADYLAMFGFLLNTHTHTHTHTSPTT